jgi:hypothetical protein
LRSAFLQQSLSVQRKGSKHLAAPPNTCPRTMPGGSERQRPHSSLLVYLRCVAACVDVRATS